MLNRKNAIIRLIAGLDKKRHSINKSIFSKTKIFSSKCES